MTKEAITANTDVSALNLLGYNLKILHYCHVKLKGSLAWTHTHTHSMV
jgi:hypothetical protein